MYVLAQNAVNFYELVASTVDEWNVSTEQWWAENERGKLKYWRQNYHSAILLTTNPKSKVLLAYLLHDWLDVFVVFLR